MPIKHILGICGYHAPVLDYASEWETKWYHDSAAVLIVDGCLVAAAEEERFTRKKHTGSFPLRAIEYCLTQGKIRLDDIDCIAVGEQGGSCNYQDPELSREKVARTLQEVGLSSFDVTSKVRLIEHHIAHAMSAYYPSGHSDALVLTLDGFGDGIAGLVLQAQAGDFRVLRRLQVSQSLGNFYGASLPYFGYGPFDEYKLMGLAAYGDPTRFESTLSKLYDLLPDGDYALNLRSRAELVELLQPLGPPRLRGTFEQHHMDLAASLQGAFEKIVFHVLRHFAQTTGLKALCLAGGCAQNSVVNGRIARSGIFDHVFVQPASNDAGTALGAALLEANRSSNPPRRMAMGSGCWGKDIADEPDLATTFAKWASFIEYRRLVDADGEVATLLAQGHVVGWVQGRSEFGPRALGARSILADPRTVESQQRINAVIKEREAYRPFAPAVVEEAASHYFELPESCQSAPFMTFTVPVRPLYRAALPAITHVDGSARVQTVSQSENPRFWRLLKAFGDLSGFPVLLNTSFNSSREPIVQSALDAITCLLTSQLHYLVIGDYLLKKRTFAKEALLELRVSVPSHVHLAMSYDRLENPTCWVTTKGAQQTPISKELMAWLCVKEPIKSQLPESAQLAEELYAMWVDRLVTLQPEES